MEEALEFVLQCMEKQENGNWYFVAKEALSLTDEEVEEIKEYLGSLTQFDN